MVKRLGELILSQLASTVINTVWYWSKKLWKYRMEHNKKSKNKSNHI